MRALRKEVIQPHLPVRLPCYDFTPIIDSPPSAAPPKGWPLASGVANFRGVTGGVYKAGNVFTAALLIGITSDSGFMKSSCRLQSELRMALGFAHLAVAARCTGHCSMFAALDIRGMMT